MRRAAAQPARRLYTFLGEEGDEEGHLTFAELDRQARAIGALLQAQARPGARAVLLYPPGLEYIASFFGCLYSGLLAVPAYPPDPTRLQRTLPRLLAIIRDAEATVVLSTSVILSMTEFFFEEAPDLKKLRWVATDERPEGLENAWKQPDAGRDTLAFLQYTSGSTGTPKGVMLSHGNLLHNLEASKKAMGFTTEGSGVFWLPPYHDMGLIGGLLAPLHSGFPSALMSPLTFMKRPRSWLEAVTRYKATLTGSPNFGFELCVRKVPPADQQGLDLSSLKVTFCGAEPIRPETAQRFTETFATCGLRPESFYPCYGLAEGTLIASGAEILHPPVHRCVDAAALGRNQAVAVSADQPGALTLVSSGRTVLDQELAIVDPETLARCPPGALGEIWVRGGSVAQGYWNRPEESERTFRARTSDTGEGPFLRTGDLGFLSGVELFVAARLKDLIIIRGRNLYPQDVENTTERSHPALRPGCTAAFSVDVGGEERLVVVQELDARRAADPEEVAAAIRRDIAAQHEVQPYAVALLASGGIHKTTSGKIQRRACKAAFLEESLEAVYLWRAAAAEAPAAVPPPPPAAAAGPDAPTRDEEQVRQWLVRAVAAATSMPPERIDIHEPFAQYGLGSAAGVTLAGDLQQWLQRKLPATLVWEHPSIAALARHLVGGLQARPPASVSPVDSGEPIAIIGLGCRFPGGARDPRAFWELLCRGGDAITPIPADRWDADRYYDPDPLALGKMSTRHGGFIEDVDRFDADFFGIAPREAVEMDPQQRLLLEVAWEALEDAGQAADGLAGSATGVFTGITTSDYGRLLTARAPEALGTYSATGVAPSVVSGRLSYVLGLQGPSLALDTACSSSLVAVHLACQSLRLGECGLALAGGVSLMLGPEPFISFSRARLLAPDGRCKTFSEGADGYGRGEGCGVVVLKRLSQAVADGDRVYAVIRGSAVNQDGRSNGLTAPNGLAQEAVLRGALATTGIAPADVGYVEAHGTGTPLGDPIELRALHAVLGEGRPAGHPLWVGSVKTNIGHLEAAAGVAGLIKAVLAVHHGQIPAHLHAERLNPELPLEDGALGIPRVHTPWVGGRRGRIAGVSSFGFSGTNAHVVVAEAPPAAPAPVTVTGREAEREAEARLQVLPLSARSPAALGALARSYLALLGTSGAPLSFADMVRTAGVRRSHHAHRLALVGRSAREVAGRLESFLRGETGHGVLQGHALPGRRRKVAFVFSGQGSQWVGMGRQLLREPAFRECLEQCEQGLRPYVDWSLLSVLTEDGAAARLREVDVVQPTLFCIQIALVALWRAFGVEPDAVVGHSMGEVAAAFTAGALTLDDALRIICVRSRLVKGVSGHGGMALVELSLEQATEAIQGAGALCVAAVNGPEAVLLSGETQALDALLEQLKRRDVYCRRVEVDYASHGPQMDPLEAPLLEALKAISPRATTLPFYSTVSASVAEGTALDARYWARNLRERVLFSSGIERLLADGYGCFVELSPHPVLLPSIERQLRHDKVEGAAVLSTLRRGEDERGAVLESLGALYAIGHPVDWSRQQAAGTRPVELPTYPWQRQRYWLEGGPAVARPAGAHPLLGTHLEAASPAGTHYWELDLASHAYLRDHVVQGAVLLPATACLELALAAAEAVFGPGPHQLHAVEFVEAFLLDAQAPRRAQLVLAADGPGQARFQLLSCEASAQGQASRWQVHARGTLHVQAPGSAAPAPRLPLAEIEARCPELLSGAQHYATIRAAGLDFGPAFRALEELRRHGKEALGRVRLPEALALQARRYQLHPSLLDACFQVLGSATLGHAAAGQEDAIYLPAGLATLRVHGKPGPALRVYAVLNEEASIPGQQVVGDVYGVDDSGQVVLEALGLRARHVPMGAARGVDKLFYTLAWQPAPLRVAPEAPAAGPGSWLLLADRHGVADALERLLRRDGGTCIQLPPASGSRPDELRRALRDAFEGPGVRCRGVINLWALDAPGDGGAALLHLIQAMVHATWKDAPRLWVITRGTQQVGEAAEAVSPDQAVLWGMGRTAALEHPELGCTLVDLDAGTAAAAQAQALRDELLANDPEPEVALRGGARYAGRLVRGLRSPGSPPLSSGRRAGDQPFRLELPRSGVRGGPRLQPAPRRAPGPGEVELEVEAVGLSARDALLAQGALTEDGGAAGPLLGLECSGRVTRCGEGVTHLREGMAVLALAPGCAGPYVTAPAAWTLPRPAHLSAEEAATLPMAFLTAHLALSATARLAPGERLLLHDAASDVGLAALQLARRMGADVLATARSSAQRELLRGMGLAHVLDPTSADFAREVRALTGGHGVDVVLSPLPGSFHPVSLEALDDQGRLVQVGPAELLGERALELRHFQRGLSFTVVDPAALLRRRPAVVGAALAELAPLFAQRALLPLPRTAFPIARFQEGLQALTAAHAGKVLLSLQDRESARLPHSAGAIRSDASYLITGGLGGLGLLTAGWLVRKGARHLVLMGRGAPSAAAAAAIQALERAGASVAVARGDVAREQDVARVLAEIDRGQAPLRGILHCAGILDDGALLQLKAERLVPVAAPKVLGARHLHALTLDRPLELFVLFSSAASLMGSPGQGNYAAANAFLDALAHHRSQLGLAALSVNWGAWAEVGLAAAQDNRGARLAAQGFTSLAPAQALDALERLLAEGAVQAGVLDADWTRWRQLFPAVARSPYFSALGMDGAAPEQPLRARIREELEAAEPANRRPLLDRYLQAQLARVLRRPDTGIDPHAPLSTLGLDSLMSLELRNRLEPDLGLKLSATLMWRCPTLNALAPYLAEQMKLAVAGQEDPPAPAHPTDDAPDALIGKVADLSDEEVDRLLAEKMRG